MAAPAVRKLRPREQFPKTPEGTYTWLEQYDGFEYGMNLPVKRG